MSVTVVSFLAMAVGQDQARPKVGFKDTPMLPGNRWEGKHASLISQEVGDRRRGD